MSLTLNMVGGGSGGGEILPTDALLRVQATAGATVTITKGVVTKSDLGHENALDPTYYDYYFIIHQSQFDSVNPWTVTATLGVGVSSDTIIIDDSAEYGMRLTPLVPSAYQAVEFIQGTGSQFLRSPSNIITSYDSTAKYEFVFDFVPVSFGSEQMLWGMRSTVNDSRWGVYRNQNNLAYYDATGLNNLSNIAGLTNNTYYHEVLTVNQGSVTYLRNGTSIKTGTTSKLPLDTRMGLLTLVMDDKWITGYAGKAKLYFSSFSINDAKVFNMIPCYRRSDSVAGMFDTVSETFCTNDGTGTFTVGSDVK